MIKQMGYVPNIEAVLHNVEDEQKESYLNYHSEKLAITYGLMKTPFLAPIRVIKNLRICDDCHTAVKPISKVTNRMIIVRDASRFHYFCDGTCTCADHWYHFHKLKNIKHSLRMHIQHGLHTFKFQDA
ncbi:putative DYW domain-containing protein [Medicago truncatula]|uniref:DYW nucleic acid deaminase family protein n=1 Tax=Medicago truncatula TaxID=3880 RepID=A0A072U757_MEDTR|nr:DYW nucleic acid deaminase family protein [Medicago truncatula]RHN54560.1 putative DYW domain-containing protein [Medicago truncatula]